MTKSVQIMNIKGIKCYERDGVAYLKLETVVRGLGFTVTQTVKGKEYVNIRWDRVDGYLAEIGFTICGKRPEFIPESVFYRLAMKAKNETAERFQAKVADEIIPSIRKYGWYISGQYSLSDDELFERALMIAQRKIAERDRTIAEKDTKIREMRPKEVFADAVAASHTSILIGDLAKLIAQNGVDIGQKRLFAWMRSNGFLIKRKGSDWNMPTQYSIKLGLFEVKECAINNPDGTVRITRTTKVTGKGQLYFIQKFLGEDWKG